MTKLKHTNLTPTPASGKKKLTEKFAAKGILPAKLTIISDEQSQDMVSQMIYVMGTKLSPLEPDSPAVRQLLQSAFTWVFPPRPQQVDRATVPVFRGRAKGRMVKRVKISQTICSPKASPRFKSRYERVVLSPEEILGTLRTGEQGSMSGQGDSCTHFPALKIVSDALILERAFDEKARGIVPEDPIGEVTCEEPAEQMTMKTDEKKSKIIDGNDNKTDMEGDKGQQVTSDASTAGSTEILTNGHCLDNTEDKVISGDNKGSPGQLPSFFGQSRENLSSKSNFIECYDSPCHDTEHSPLSSTIQENKEPTLYNVDGGDSGLNNNKQVSPFPPANDENDSTQERESVTPGSAKTNFYCGHYEQLSDEDQTNASWPQTDMKLKLIGTDHNVESDPAPISGRGGMFCEGRNDLDQVESDQSAVQELGVKPQFPQQSPTQSEVVDNKSSPVTQSQESVPRQSMITPASLPNDDNSPKGCGLTEPRASSPECDVNANKTNVPEFSRAPELIAQTFPCSSALNLNAATNMTEQGLAQGLASTTFAIIPNALRKR